MRGSAILSLLDISESQNGPTSDLPQLSVSHSQESPWHSPSYIHLRLTGRSSMADAPFNPAPYLHKLQQGLSPSPSTPIQEVRDVPDLAVKTCKIKSITLFARQYCNMFTAVSSHFF